MKTYFETCRTVDSPPYESDQSQFSYESKSIGEDLRINGGQLHFDLELRISKDCPTMSMEPNEGNVCIWGNLFFPSNLIPS